MSLPFTNAAKPASAILLAVLSVYAPFALAQADSPSVDTVPFAGSALTANTPQGCGDKVSAEGSWLFEVKGVQNPSSYWTAVASFATGGVWLATGSKDRLNPASPLYGTWKCIGRDRYNSTTYFFIFDPAHPDTEAIATLKTNQVFRLKSPNRLVGYGNVSICDLEGRNCTSLPANDVAIHGVRIVPGDPTELLEKLPTK